MFIGHSGCAADTCRGRPMAAATMSTPAHAKMTSRRIPILMLN
jgi:hypothetical protein